MNWTSLKSPEVPHDWGSMKALPSQSKVPWWDWKALLIGLKCPPMKAMDNDNGKLTLMDAIDRYDI